MGTKDDRVGDNEMQEIRYDEIERTGRQEITTYDGYTWIDEALNNLLKINYLGMMDLNQYLETMNNNTSII